MADALDSKSNDRKVVRVRLPPRAPFLSLLAFEGTMSCAAAHASRSRHLRASESPSKARRERNLSLGGNRTEGWVGGGAPPPCRRVAFLRDSSEPRVPKAQARCGPSSEIPSPGTIRSENTHFSLYERATRTSVGEESKGVFSRKRPGPFVQREMWCPGWESNPHAV